jgi:hypothetical protein
MEAHRAFATRAAEQTAADTVPSTAQGTAQKESRS